MELETVFDEINAFVKSKDNDLYKKSSMILDTLKNLLEKSGINSQEALGYTNLILEKLKQQVQQKKFAYLDSYLMLLNKFIPKCSQKIIQMFSEQGIQLVLSILQECRQKELMAEKFAIAILGQFYMINQNLTIVYETLVQYSLSNQPQLRRESVRVLKQILELPSLEIQLNLNNLIKQQYLPLLQDLDNTENISLVILCFNQLFNSLSVQVLNDFLQQFMKIIEVVENETQMKIYLAIEQVCTERTLSEEMSSQLLNHFLQSYPSYEDTKQIYAYIQAVTQVLLNLQKFNKLSSQKFVGNVVLNFSDYILQVQDYKIQGFAKKYIEILIIKCIDSSMWRQTDQNQDDLNDLIQNMEVERVNHFYQFVCTLKNMITENDSIQSYVLSIIGTFFSKVQNDCFDQVLDLVKALIYNKQQYNVHNWEKCFEKLIFNIDLDLLIKEYPLTIQNLDPLANDFENVSNLWILSLTLKFAKNQKLSTFIQYFYPIQTYLLNINEQDQGRRKIYESIYIQIWDCFHRFNRVSNSNDDKQAFEEFINKLPRPNQNTELSFDEKSPNFKYLIRGLRVLFDNVIGFQVQGILKQRARFFIGQFAKIYTSENDPQKYLLSCIQSLSKLVDQSYCQEKYQEHMKKLLQTDSNWDTQSNKHLKNIEIIMRIVNQVSLDGQYWETTVQVLKQQLQQSKNHSLQKKVYKLLQLIIKIKNQSFYSDILDLIFQSFTNLSPKSKFNRMTCIYNIYISMDYDQLQQQQFLQRFIPEIITNSRDPNQKLRNLVDKFLDDIYKKCQTLGIQQSFLDMICVGFTSQASCTIADTVQVVTAFIKEDVRNNYFPIILALSQKNNKEVYKACLYYFKHFIKSQNREQIQSKANLILENLLDANEQIKQANQSQLKFIIERLLRKLGQDNMNTLFPEQHKNLLKSIQKLKRQEINKKQKLKLQRIKDKKANKGGAIQEEEQQEQQNQDDEDNNMLLKFDNEKENFHFVEKGINLKKLKEDEKKKIEEQKEIEFKNGKLVVNDINMMTGQKRKKQNNEEEMEELNEDAEKTVYKRRINKLKVRQQQNTIHQIKESGDSYKAKGQTKGDVTHKNKPAPYAFIQLNPKALNSRYRTKSQKVLESVINKKSTGAFKGLKTQK